MGVQELLFILGNSSSSQHKFDFMHMSTKIAISSLCNYRDIDPE